MAEMMTGTPSLEELSKAATQGEWSLGALEGGYRYINAAGRKSHPGLDQNTPWTGLARFVVEMEEGGTCAGAANVSLAVALVNDFRAGRLHTSEALAQAIAAARVENPWQDISTAPCDPARGYDFDLPGDADDGLGYATDVDTGVIEFLVWWTRTGPGRSKVTHWRPKPEGPTTPQTDTASPAGGGRA